MATLQPRCSTIISKVFALLVSLRGVAAVSVEEIEDVALASDDQCSAGNASECALNALQLRGPKASCAQYSCVGYVKSHACQCDIECKKHSNCCRDFAKVCGADVALKPAVPRYEGNRSKLNRRGRIVTGFHETSPEIGKAILKYGFRSGHVGYCGGGIYFARGAGTTGAKAIGPDSHHGMKLRARIDLGNYKRIGKPSCFSPQLGKVIDTPVSHFLHQFHADSFIFNPRDGVEYVIADPSRVLSVRKYR